MTHPKPVEPESLASPRSPMATASKEAKARYDALALVLRAQRAYSARTARMRRSTWPPGFSTEIPMTPKKMCSVDSCDRKSRCRGYCDLHYQRYMKHGTTDIRTPHFRDPEDALAARTERKGECLVWTGALDDCGYGSMWAEGRKFRAHRWVWEQRNGPIPPDSQLDHACRNRACVEVSHLRLASISDNSAYRKPRKRAVHDLPRGVHPNGSGYCARVIKQGKVHHLGTFPTVELADEAAKAGRARLHGIFAYPEEDQ